MKVSKKKLVAGLAWIPLGLMGLGHQIFIQPALAGLPLGGVIGGIIFWCLHLPFVFSISYAIVMALYGVFIGACFIIASTIWFVDDRVDTSWLEGEVSLPDIPQALFTAIRGFVAGLLTLAATTVQSAGGWVTPDPDEPSELEEIRDAYARGELSDLEMEQQIEEAMGEDHDTS